MKPTTPTVAPSAPIELSTAPSRWDVPDVRGVEPLPRGESFRQRAFVLFDVVVPFAGLIAATVWLWGRMVTSTDLAIAVGFYLVTMLGITVGFHRMFAHKGFDAPAPVRAVFGALGIMALQGPIIQWCADHRRHHAYSDREGDPHSPHVDVTGASAQTFRGLVWAHVGWMFAPVKSTPTTWVPDLLADRTVVRLDRLYLPLVLASLALPALVGFLVTGTASGALTAFLWGGLVRLFVCLHATWSINSICHVFGRRTYVSKDESRNVWALSVLSLGESWHNNHHAFPSSARHGIDRWQLDPSGFVIDTMERLGLIDNVSRVSAAQKARRRIDRRREDAEGARGTPDAV
jgi:stearoyl-CoA desaturase (Delta-9 desaturase)